MAAAFAGFDLLETVSFCLPIAASNPVTAITEADRARLSGLVRQGGEAFSAVLITEIAGAVALYSGSMLVAVGGELAEASAVDQLRPFPLMGPFNLLQNVANVWAPYAGGAAAYVVLKVKIFKRSPPRYIQPAAPHLPGPSSFD